MGKLLGDRDRVSDDCWLNNSCRVIPTTRKVGIRWRKKKFMSLVSKMLIFEKWVEISRRQLDKQVCRSEARPDLETEIRESSACSHGMGRACPEFCRWC